MAPALRFKQLYLISFIEGGVVMVAEVAGAKILTPFFGASLYSWASTLSITLLALMLGYYYGGYFTTKPKYNSSVYIPLAFMLSGLSVALMPALGRLVMRRTISFSFYSGLIISELTFLFIPIFLMGMIGPMIIYTITEKAEHSGRSAGNIYAISTCGGIIFTLVFGFLIIPYYGISMPLRILGLFVCTLGLFLLLKNKKINKIPITVLLMTSALIILLNSKSKFKASNGYTKLLASSEGLLGELKVIDQVTFPPNSKPVTIRKLRINNIMQNFVFSDLPTQSLMYYITFTKQFIRNLAPGKTALQIGLGAGSLYKILKEKYEQVESVEIDKRFLEIGMKYFNLDKNINSKIVDGRYYVNVTNQKYSFIMVDAILAESAATQLLTLECFQKLYSLLDENGTLMIENGGLIDFSKNSFVPSIYKTLRAAGFYVEVFNPVLSKEVGDALFVATKHGLEIKNMTISDDVFIKGGPVSTFSLDLNSFDTNSATVLTDDKDNSDIHLKAHSLKVRRNIRKELAKNKFWE